MSRFTCSGVRLVCPARVSSSHVAHAEDLRGLDLDVGGLAVPGLPHRGLVDEHPGVREREALARRTGREQHGRSRGRLAEHHGLDLRRDVLHRVVDRRHRGERATGRVDVHRDVTLGILALQDEELRHHVVGRGVVDLHAEEDHAVFEQLVVRVLTLEAVGRALLELREHVAAGGQVTG